MRRQIDNLRKSGLLDATTTFFVSCIAGNQADVECLKRIINSDKLVIISNVTDPKRYEYPALEFIKQLSEKEDCLFYYFHTKGISYQSLTSNDRLFCSFKTKMNTWVVLDFFGIVSGITACFIRLGNLMNSEIIGKVTDVPWAFIFYNVDDKPRHPGQLYEAIAFLGYFLYMK